MSSKTKYILSMIFNGLVFVCGVLGVACHANPLSFKNLIYYTFDSCLFCAIASAVCLALQIAGIYQAKQYNAMLSQSKHAKTHRQAMDIYAESLPNWALNFKYIGTCMVTITFLVVCFVLVPMCSQISAVSSATGGMAVPGTAAQSSSAISAIMSLAPADGSPVGVGVAIYGMFFQPTTLFHHLLTPLLAIVSLIFFDQKSTSGRKIILYSLVPSLIYYVVLIVLNVVGMADGPYPFLQVMSLSVFKNLLWFVLLLGNCLLVGFLLYEAWIRPPKK